MFLKFVARLIHRRLQNERLIAKLRMIQDAAKPGLADEALADVLVPVDMRAERRLRIVGVDHAHVFDAQHPIDFRHGVLQSGRGS